MSIRIVSKGVCVGGECKCACVYKGVWMSGECKCARVYEGISKEVLMVDCSNPEWCSDSVATHIPIRLLEKVP